MKHTKLAKETTGNQEVKPSAEERRSARRRRLTEDPFISYIVIGMFCATLGLVFLTLYIFEGMDRKDGSRKENREKYLPALPYA